jgi:hypothetical protein
MPLPESLCSTLFAAVYKRPGWLKEGWGIFLVLPLAFTLGFGLILLLWAFWCGKLLERKRIT